MIDFFLLISLLFLLPKYIVEKKFPLFCQKLFFRDLPDIKGRELIWIHGVSLGEIKSALLLFEKLKKHYPTHFFFITTTTATGQEEAKRSFIGADGFGYLPFDLSWIVRKWVRKLQPKLFILVETDFWPNLLTEIRRFGGKIALVSGKMSERSFSRFQKVPFFSKRLFSLFDFIGAQNREHFARFYSLGIENSKLAITGNLKLDYRPEKVTIPEKLKNKNYQPAVTIASTHRGEEERLLEELDGVQVFLFLVPRHPERFEEVAALLQSRKISYGHFSRLEELTGEEKVLLVDEMGKLPICYSLSQLAIVGGSFMGDVGGHNVIEPCFYQVPVFFGPFMYAQKEFREKILSGGVGKEVELSQIGKEVADFFENREQFSSNLKGFFKEGKRPSEKTFLRIERLLKKELGINDLA